MTKPKTAATTSDSTLHGKIAERAYHLFEQRGRTHGHAMEDWLRAEREVRASSMRRTPAPRAKSPTNGRAHPTLGKAA